MKRGNGLILALALAFLSACASAGGPGATGEAGGAGNRPGDNSYTRSAGVALAQAGLSQGDQQQAHYQTALDEALKSIQEDSTNAKGYLLAGQAAVGLGHYIQADTMFDKAEALYPGYADQLVSEREQGWVDAYNQAAEALNAGDLQKAQELFEGADRLYQGRPEAKMALGAIYVRQNEFDKAIAAYKGALDILDAAPPEGVSEDQLAQWDQDRRVAAFNASQLMAQNGQFDQAAQLLGSYLESYGDQLDSATELQALTAQAGYLAQAGKADEAEALYGQILNRTDLSSADYFQIGIGFFNTGDFARAADAFQKSAELNPYSRDALLNLVQSLYSEAQELDKTEETPARNQKLSDIYDQILEAAQQVREFDPLNRNVLSFMLRAYRAKADLSGKAEAQKLTQKTQELYREYQQMKYEVTNVSLTMQGGDQAQISGTLTNVGGTAGQQVSLRFQLLDKDGGVINTSTATVTLPEQGQSVDFSTPASVAGGQFAGWRYELVE